MSFTSMVRKIAERAGQENLDLSPTDNFSKTLEVSRAQYSSLMAKNREIFAYTSEKSFRKEATAATRPRY